MENKENYFQHDYNPANDPKIVCLLGNFGGMGYGVFWRNIEMLHSEKEHKLPLKKYIFEAIAKQMLTSVEQIETIINACINDYELFCSDGKFYWSNRVNRNFEKRDELSEKRREAGKKSANIRWGELASVKQVITSVKQNETNHAKEKKIKEKENSLETKRFVPPTIEEVRAYCLERKNNINPEYFVNSYISKGWMVGNSKMKNWKAAIVTWEQRDKENNHQQQEQKPKQRIITEDLLNSLGL